MKSSHYSAEQFDFAMRQAETGTLEVWRQEYNISRPHGALGNLSPAEYSKVKELVA